MAQKLTWTHEALNDLEMIADFIARDSDHYAKVFVKSIIGKCESLSDFPRIGRVVPEITNENIRELIISDYRVIYKYEDLHVSILRVIHGKRDFKNIWKQESSH